MDKIPALLVYIDGELTRAYKDGKNERYFKTITDNDRAKEHIGMELARLDMGRRLLNGAVKLGKLTEEDIKELSELTFRKDESDMFMSRLKE